MSKKGNGKLRVLAALRSQGARGITRVDFQAPNVIDGGEPILNIPGRIYDLRQDGHEIIEDGKRNRCTVYRLLRDAQDATPAPREVYVDQTLGTWDGAECTGRLAIFDDDLEAA